MLRLRLGESCKNEYGLDLTLPRRSTAKGTGRNEKVLEELDVELRQLACFIHLRRRASELAELNRADSALAHNRRLPLPVPHSEAHHHRSRSVSIPWRRDQKTRICLVAASPSIRASGYPSVLLEIDAPHMPQAHPLHRSTPRSPRQAPRARSAAAGVLPRCLRQSELSLFPCNF